MSAARDAALADVVARHKIEAAVANLRLQLAGEKARSRMLASQVAEAEERIQVLLALEGNTPRTRYKVRPHSKTSESVAVVQLTDWHVEETVKAAAVSGLNRYNLKVAEQRIARLADKLVYLLKLNRAGTRIDTLVVHLGGDLMTGHIHDDLKESNSLHPVEAVMWLHDRVSALLRHLLNDSGCAQVICVCNVGNHGRTTDKKRINTRVETSYEWLLYRMLEKQLPDIDWRIAGGYFQWLDVFGAQWRFHHGDAIRYQGGVGGITIPVNKAVAQWNKAREADFDFFGHWHQSIFMREWCCNGSVIGYSAHSQEIKADFEPPTQNLILWEKDLGRTGMWPIYVD